VAKLCLFFCYYFVFGIVPCVGQYVSSSSYTISEKNEIRKAVFDTALYYSKIVREPYKKGMNNNHWAITKFNKAMKIASTSPYCSTFGIFCWGVNGIRFQGVDGRAYSWRQPKKLVWHRGMLAIDRSLWPKIQLMDAVVCTWSHVEFVAPGSTNSYLVGYSKYGITTIAGNTRGGKDRPEGVYYPIQRPFAYIFGIYNHF
jgi:hypothetical protein